MEWRTPPEHLAALKERKNTVRGGGSESTRDAFMRYNTLNGAGRQNLPGRMTWEEHVAIHEEARATLEEERSTAIAVAAAEQAAAYARQDTEDEREYLRQRAEWDAQEEATASLASVDAHALCTRHPRMQDEAEYLQLRAEYEAERSRAVEAAIEASHLPSLSLSGILARHAGPSLQAAKFAPLLAPRLSCHAVQLRSVLPA